MSLRNPGNSICAGCLQEIDLKYCHCGEAESGASHTFDYTHAFVPAGCACWAGSYRSYKVFAPAAEGGLLAESQQARERAYQCTEQIQAIAHAAYQREETDSQTRKEP